jgi:hypothetical protein
VALETPIWLQGGTYSARLDRGLLDIVFAEGVVNPGGGALQVSERALGANDTVDVAAGAAIITGDDEQFQGKYYVRMTAGTNIPFDPSPVSNQRIDLLCLRVNDPTAGGPAGDDAEFIVVAGSVAAVAVPPATPTTAIPLAEVLRLSTDTTIVDARITDARPVSSTNVYTVRSFFETLSSAQRDLLTPFVGQTIFNTTLERIEVYDGTSWRPLPSDIDDLDDVTVTGVAGGDIFEYDSGSSKWVNRVGTDVFSPAVVTIDEKTAAYTLALSDRNRLIRVNSSSNLTVTVPTNATVAFAVGSKVDLWRQGTGNVTVAGASGVTLRSADNAVTLADRYSGATLMKIGTDEWLLVGDLE